jgi:hypothetical protein
MEWPDKLRLEINDPLGNRRALLLVNGDNSWWEAENDPILYSRHGLKPLLGLPYSGKELVRAFLARPDLADWVMSDEGEGELVFRRKQERLVVSGRLSEPELWSTELDDHQTIRIDYENYVARNGIDFPGSVRLAWASPQQEKNSLLWNWGDFSPSVPENSTLFQIPPPNSKARTVKSF